ncbi:MAG: aminopeptidase P family protein [Candidatus Cryptobacteroides sp.]
MENIHAERIASLRAMMEENGWDAVIVSGSDPHSGEYPAPRWKQVEWLSGFTGEAGDIVVTSDHAGLWTDSRYFIQALSQLEGTGVELHKTRQPDSVGIPQWLSLNGLRSVAVDGLCVSAGFVGQLYAALSETGGRVHDVPDLLGALWTDRPAIPVTPVTTLDVDSFGGIPRVDKISWLRKWMMLSGVDAVLLTALDEIAWMLNVRGNDIEYNPLVISHLLVTQDYVRWFVTKPEFCAEPDLETTDSFSELEMDDVQVLEYDAVYSALADLADENPDAVIFVDPSTLNHHLNEALGDLFPSERIVRGTSPVILEKAVKTDSEIAALRQTYQDDGVAMEMFLHWLESEVASGEALTEWEASERLTEFRAEIPGYRGNSFENISAYGENAALPHYCTPRKGSAVIQARGLYLVDSGGQYLTGTTDITRTVPMGPCTPLEKEDYTLVLKGMIALSMAVFPRGTAGCQIDVLARAPLWRSKRNFGHGTGHGIGYWLCVHEGPQDIRQNFNQQPLLPGMVTSNEPGIYREGMHGIRHENVVLCKEAGRNGFGDWLEFETLTCCHIDTSAVLADLLTADETQWLNSYNEHVYQTLSPLLPPEVASWLREKTKAI